MGVLPRGKISLVSYFWHDLCAVTRVTFSPPPTLPRTLRLLSRDDQHPGMDHGHVGHGQVRPRYVVALNLDGLPAALWALGYTRYPFRLLPGEPAGRAPEHVARPGCLKGSRQSVWRFRHAPLYTGSP